MVSSIKVIRSGKVRRAKLYYLRDREGKSARIAEKIKKNIGIDVEVKSATTEAVSEDTSTKKDELKKEVTKQEAKKITEKKEVKKSDNLK